MSGRNAQFDKHPQIIVRDERGQEVTWGDVMTAQEYRGDVANGYLIDYDGSGHVLVPTNQPNVYRRGVDTYPSRVGRLPADAQYVIWYNR